MTSTAIAQNTSLDTRSIDLATVDVDRAMQQGRRLRSEAFTSILKSLFQSHRDERTDRRGDFSTNCAAPA